MSRCFPFPPPGYEKKPTTDEPDLLKKEKRKEKKHKKDKKDKEKREGKEKREKDKDRSDGKHKDKKDKKDKHRDKKKDKEKGKIGISDEKKLHAQSEGYNGENLPNNEKRVSSSDKKSSSQFPNGEYTEHILSKDKNSSLDDKKSPIFRGQNGELLAQNRIKAEDTENFKFVQELGRRIRDEEKGTGGSHQFVAEGRKNNVNIQKTDWRQEAGFGRNAAVQSKINGSPPPPPLLPLPVLPPTVLPPLDKKERVQENEGGDDKRGGKRKNKDREKKEKKEQKKSERDKNKHIMKNNSVASFNSLPARSSEHSFQGVGIEGNLKKRKDIESNGVLHENELRPNKMARHVLPENGRKLDFPQNQCSSFKVGSKDQRVNGMIASPPGAVAAKRPPVSDFNHIPAKPTPIKSPPVITNHNAAQPPTMPTAKPPPSFPNHIAAQPPRPTTKSPPTSIPNHITAHPPPPAPPSTTTKQPISQPKPSPPPPQLPAVPSKLAPAPPPVPPPPPLPTPKKKPPAAEPSTKPPHPDTKYLNQILSVPKLDQWCGLDDQEWLFSGKSDQASKKPTMEELKVQVWSEAKHIESVDVCALPYVIPY